MCFICIFVLMLFRLRKYISVFAVLIFMFPSIVEGLHSFEHADDFHCNSSDKHFHEKEYHCFICDFIAPFSDTPNDVHHSFVSKVVSFSYTPFIENVVLLFHNYNIFLRGPPALA